MTKTNLKRKHSKQIKFKAALELYKSDKTANQISKEYGVHQNVVQRWKKKLIEEGPELFEDNRTKKSSSDSTESLERKIGQLTMEIDFLKKVLGQ
jgi:transposase-like protein